MYFIQKEGYLLVMPIICFSLPHIEVKLIVIAVDSPPMPTLEILDIFP